MRGHEPGTGLMTAEPDGPEMARLLTFAYGVWWDAYLRDSDGDRP